MKKSKPRLLKKNKLMPKGEELAQKAQKQLIDNYSRKGINPFEPSYLKIHCDEILNELLDLEFAFYKEAEKLAKVSELWALVKHNLPDSKNLSNKDLEEAIKSSYDSLRSFFQSISQSRMTRAGSSLEKHLYFIFQTLKYPFQFQRIINGKPDFILPDADSYKKIPSECILVTAKRTLRERWRQIITEGFQSPQYFLVTIDTKQSANNLKEMAGHRIYLVVPNKIKKEKPIYAASGTVLSIRSFLNDYLDPAMKRWKQSGIIS